MVQASTCHSFFSRSLTTFGRVFFLSLIASALLLPVAVDAQQTKRKKTENAVVKGKIRFSDRQLKTADGKSLKIGLGEIEGKLREYVDLPPPKLPAGFKTWPVEKRIKWEQEFTQSDVGKKHIESNRKLLEKANSFDIKFGNDGSFVVFDVPAGDYGIQGRTDKVIGTVTYAFEVFGQLKIQKEVDELVLAPIEVDVTPLLKQGDAAPGFSLKTHDNKATLNRETFKDSIIFVNFWSSVSPSAAAEQKMVQEMFVSLKEKYSLRLLSVNVDEDRKQALDYLAKNSFREGSHGFTDGMEDETLFNFGVRGVPSFWLIGKDGKVMMSQYEFAKAMRVKPDLTTIVSDRIEGKDEPTLAPKPEADKQ